MTPARRKRLILSIIALVLSLLSIGILITEMVLYGSEDSASLPFFLSMLFPLLEEILLAAAVLIIMIVCRRTYYLRPRTGGLTGIILIITGLAVCVANFPFTTIASGDLVFTRLEYLPLYILLCVSISLFEEFLFRGLLLPMLLDRMHRSKAGIILAIILSSALFGVSHFLNLFQGADVIATLVQVGYAFFVGCLCCVVMLESGSLLWPVLFHVVFNLGGLMESAGIAVGPPSTLAGEIIFGAVSVIALVVYAVCFFLDRRIVLKTFNR